MRKLICASVISLLFAIPAVCQNFEPEPNAVQEKLENALKRYGTIERVYLNDKVKKTFEAKPGKEYYAWVVYKISSTVVRRMMIIQLGPEGEKVKINYPKFNQAISDAENQAFFIQVNAPLETNSSTISYKVDASPESTVYIYEVTRGFKRD